MLRIFGVALIVVALIAVAVPPTAAQQPCRFVLGFAALRDAVGAEKVGNCLEDERFNTANGNAEQRTSGGLMVWRKADNFTAFTDGSHSWINGPNGLQTRANSERFTWERDPIPPAAQASPSATPTLNAANSVSTNVAATVNAGRTRSAIEIPALQTSVAATSTAVMTNAQPTVAPISTQAAANAAAVATEAANLPPSRGNDSNGSRPAGNCHPSYPDFCIPPPPPDVNCGSAVIAGRKNFRVTGPDVHRLDQGGRPGIACE